MPGKSHEITDTLSRAPLYAPEEDPDITVDTALTCLAATSDPAIDMVLSSIDDDYRLCTQDILNNMSYSKLSNTLKGLRERLSVEGFLIVLDSRRIVIPTAAIPLILSRLHSGHPGQEKTLKLAQALFYWPGMTNDIRTFLESCKPCFRNLPSLPANPVSTEPPSASYGPPMAHVGVDLLEFAGKQYLICVDKWSGFPVFKQLNTVTTRAVTGILEDWFNILGWPSTIRSDGGPQFLGPFMAWCEHNNILHELSSPSNPRGNGLAEAAVKNV